MTVNWEIIEVIIQHKDDFEKGIPEENSYESLKGIS